MRWVVWILLGWAGTCFWSALVSRFDVGFAHPDSVVVVLAFLALRRDAVVVAVAACVLGYLIGRQALAPTGLHETALVVSGVGVYALAGSLAGGGAIFYSLIAGAMTMAYHLLLYALLWLGRDHVGFSSLTAAMLVPNALLTALLALGLHPLFVALEERLAPDERQGGLSWR